MKTFHHKRLVFSTYNAKIKTELHVLIFLFFSLWNSYDEQTMYHKLKMN